MFTAIGICKIRVRMYGTNHTYCLQDYANSWLWRQDVVGHDHPGYITQQAEAASRVGNFDLLTGH